MPSRADYEKWIATTRRTQRRVLIGTGVLAAVSIGLMFWRSHVGELALFFVAVTALISYWVTAAHLSDWRYRLRELDRKSARSGRR